MITIRLLESSSRVEIEKLLNNYFSNIEKFVHSQFSDHVFSVGAFDAEKLVGHIFVHEGYQYLNDQKFYTLEYVVVDEMYRGCGIAKKLLQYVIKIAKENQIEFLTLTSKVSRIEARGLYTSFGFIGKDTGVFIKMLKG